MLKQRLISARKGANLTQADVAEYLGIRRQTYSAYERGVSTPDANTIASLARLFGVSAGELVAGEVSTANMIKVPVCGNVAAGIPIDAIEDVEEYVDVDASLARGATLIGLRVKGRSMEPRFANGDTVIIRCQSSVDNGDIAVVLVGDEATMKKVVRYTEGIRLMPTNPAYEPRYFSNEEIASLPVTILGKVVELRAKI